MFSLFKKCQECIEDCIEDCKDEKLCITPIACCYKDNILTPFLYTNFDTVITPCFIYKNNMCITPLYCYRQDDFFISPCVCSKSSVLDEYHVCSLVGCFQKYLKIQTIDGRFSPEYINNGILPCFCYFNRCNYKFISKNIACFECVFPLYCDCIIFRAYKPKDKYENFLSKKFNLQEQTRLNFCWFYSSIETKPIRQTMDLLNNKQEQKFYSMMLIREKLIETNNDVMITEEIFSYL